MMVKIYTALNKEERGAFTRIAPLDTRAAAQENNVEIKRTYFVPKVLTFVPRCDILIMRTED